MDVLKSFSLQGQVALVTGGAGLYGRQIVEALAEAGAVTFMASRNLAKLEEYAQELRDRGLDVTALELDLARQESIDNTVQEIVKRSGRFDILINNAVNRCGCRSWDLNMDDFDESFRMNASSLFYLTRKASNAMREAGNGGSIVNIASYMGLLGPNPSNYPDPEAIYKMSPAYFYEKGGMVNFTRFAASVLGRDGIRVNAICPGGFYTPDMSEGFIKNYNSNTMLGRLANDTDLKGVIVFLASAASAYLTAAVIPVDGGYVAK